MIVAGIGGLTIITGSLSGCFDSSSNSQTPGYDTAPDASTIEGNLLRISNPIARAASVVLFHKDLLAPSIGHGGLLYLEDEGSKGLYLITDLHVASNDGNDLAFVNKTDIQVFVPNGNNTIEFDGGLTWQLLPQGEIIDFNTNNGVVQTGAVFTPLTRETMGKTAFGKLMDEIKFGRIAPIVMSSYKNLSIGDPLIMFSQSTNEPLIFEYMGYDESTNCILCKLTGGRTCEGESGSVILKGIRDKDGKVSRFTNEAFGVYVGIQPDNSQGAECATIGNGSNDIAYFSAVR